MTTTPAPLPYTFADFPQIAAVEQARVDFYNFVAAIRARSGDAIAKASTVVAAWVKLNGDIAAAREQILALRTARLAWLENLLPFGPPPSAPGASDADRIITMTAWRANLAESRAATDDELEHRLADAVTFGDDLALRAGATAFTERDGGREKVTAWLLGISGDADLLAEAQRLRDEYPLWRARLNQLTAPEPAPDELAQLQAAEQAAAAAKAAAQTVDIRRGIGSLRPAGGLFG